MLNFHPRLLGDFY